MSIEIDTSKARAIVSLLSEQTTAATLRVESDGISFSELDASKTMQMRGKLLPGWFERYEVEPRDIAFSTARAIESMKGMKGIAEVSFDDKRKEIMVHAGRIRRSFRVDGGSEYMDRKVGLKYESEIVLTSEMVKEILTLMKGATAVLKISIDDDVRFTINSKDTIEWVASREEVQAVGTAHSSFNTDMMSQALNTRGLVDKATLQMTDDFPVTVAMFDADTVEDSTMLLQLTVAPYLEVDL